MTPKVIRSVTCPVCGTWLEDAVVPGKAGMVMCPRERTVYRLKLPSRVKRRVGPEGQWDGSCPECSKPGMEYCNFKYHCGCGNTIRV